MSPTTLDAMAWELEWTRGYRLGSAAADVAGNDRDDLAYLTEFLEPWCRTAPPGRAPVQVRMLRSTRATAELERIWNARRSSPLRVGPIPCVRLDTRTIAFEGWREGEALWMADPVTGCFFLVGAGTVDVVSRRGSSRARLGLLGLLREIITGKVAAVAPIVDLHASAFAVGDAAVLIAGAKGAGKTSLLCHALISAGAGLVGNDRVFIDLSASPPRAVGVPTVISIRADTLHRFPQLAHRADQFPPLFPIEAAAPPGNGGSGPAIRSADRALLLSPAGLAGRLGAARVPEAPLSAILLPEVTAGIRGCTIERLSAETARAALEACLYGASSGRNEPTLFAGLAGAAAVSPTAIGVRLERLVAAVPAYACRLGRDAYDTPAAMLLSALGLELAAA